MNRGVPPTKVTDKNICEHLSGTNFVSPDRRRPNGAVPLHQHNFTIFLNWAFTTHSHLKRGTNFTRVPQNLLIPSLHTMQPYHLPNIVPRVLSYLSTRRREPYERGLSLPMVMCIGMCAFHVLNVSVLVHFHSGGFLTHKGPIMGSNYF